MYSIIRSRPFVLWIGLAATTVCVGCSSQDIPPTVATYERSSVEGGGDSALLEGIIKTQDGCTLVVGENVDGEFIPLFGSDDANTPSMSDGDRVALKGGVLTEPPVESSIPDSCSKTGLSYWMVSY